MRRRQASTRTADGSVRFGAAPGSTPSRRCATANPPFSIRSANMFGRPVSLSVVSSIIRVRGGVCASGVRWVFWVCAEFEARRSGLGGI